MSRIGSPTTRQAGVPAPSISPAAIIRSAIRRHRKEAARLAMAGKYKAAMMHLLRVEHLQKARQITRECAA